MGGPLPKRPSTVSLSPRTLDGHHSSRCIASRICCTSCLVVSSSYGSFIFFGFRLDRREELGYRSGIVYGCNFPSSRILKGGTPITAWMPRAVRLISQGDSPESAPFDAVSWRNHSETRRLHSPPHPEAARSLARRSPHTLGLLCRPTNFRPQGISQPRPPRT